MRREAEFKTFLIKFKKGRKHTPLGADQYIDICRRIEGYMGGRDMEELVVPQTEFDATEAVLKTKGSFKNTRAVLRAYCEFASTMPASWIVVSPTCRTIGLFRVYDTAAGLVTYENSVRTYEKAAGLCAFLEAEYEKIRDFAKEKLEFIWQDFPAIPVYLSKERQKETYFYDRESTLKCIRKICAECNRENCHSPRCPAFNRMMEMENFTESIAGRYYGGAEPQIVLYFQNFASPWDMKNPAFTAAISKTLAHEYLHFLHDYYARTIAKKKFDPLANKNLREALADFFGVLYALQQGNATVAEGRYIQWLDRENTDWPYAHALKFFTKPYQENLTDYSATEMSVAIQKFRNVFQNTADPKAAVKILKL